MNTIRILAILLLSASVAFAQDANNPKAEFILADTQTVSLPNGSRVALTVEQKAGLDYAVAKANADAKPVVTGTVTTQPTPITAGQYLQDRIADVLNSYYGQIVADRKAGAQALIDGAANLPDDKRQQAIDYLQGLIQSNAQ